MTPSEASQLIDDAIDNAPTMQAASRIGEIRLVFSGYAEPGYTTEQRPIAIGDWNNISKWNESTKSFDVVDQTPSQLGLSLEINGFELGWNDEWTTCDECYRAVRTEPDHTYWKPSYVHTIDGEILCLKCAPTDEPGDEDAED